MADDISIGGAMKALLIKQMTRDEVEEQYAEQGMARLSSMQLENNRAAASQAVMDHSKHLAALKAEGYADDSSVVLTLKRQFESYLASMERVNERLAS
jgi:hypothetical protein